MTKHYIADEKLGGIEREYVESDKQAYEPTENVRIDGEVFRMVDRKAKVGENIIHMYEGKSDGVITKVMDSGLTLVDVEEYKIVDKDGDEAYVGGIVHGAYRVLEPVVSESKSVGSLNVELTVDSEVITHLIDLIGNLAKTVAEQQRELDAVKRQLRGNTSILSDRIDANTDDIQTFAETASEAKHDSHNNRLDIEVIYKYIDSIMDDIVSLDERTQSEELARTISKELAKGARLHGGR